MTATLRLGSRRSPMAVAQSRQVAGMITERTGRQVEIVGVTTPGDVSRAELTQIGGTGVFVSALREALLSGEVDLAVHSLKDLPASPVAGVVLAAVPPRDDPRDALVARDGAKLADLPAGARIRTGSPRRAAQLLALRGDLGCVPIRGNANTRLGTVHAGDLDGVVLARAGLDRIGCLHAPFTKSAGRVTTFPRTDWAQGRRQGKPPSVAVRSPRAGPSRRGEPAPDASGLIAERFGALAGLRDAGLIRHLGLPDVTTAHLAEALAIAPVVCVQNRFSLKVREHEDVLRPAVSRASRLCRSSRSPGNRRESVTGSEFRRPDRRPQFVSGLLPLGPGVGRVGPEVRDVAVLGGWLAGACEVAASHQPGVQRVQQRAADLARSCMSCGTGSHGPSAGRSRRRPSRARIRWGVALCVRPVLWP